MAIGAILGVVSVLSGVYSAYQANQQQGQLDSQIGEQNAALRAQQALAQDRYAADAYDFKSFTDDYGDVLSNLNDYYSNLSADTFSGQMHDTITQRFKQNTEALQSHVAKSGIQGSGVEAGLLAEIYADKRDADIQADIQAPQMVAQQQQQFQSQVLNPYENVLRAQQNNSWQNYMGAGNAAIQGLGTQMQNTSNQINAYNKGAQSGIQGGMGLLGQAFDSYQPQQSSSQTQTFGDLQYNDQGQTSLEASMQAILNNPTNKKVY